MVEFAYQKGENNMKKGQIIAPKIPQKKRDGFTHPNGKKKRVNLCKMPRHRTHIIREPCGSQ